jgi:hypothetical protein
VDNPVSRSIVTSCQVGSASGGSGGLTLNVIKLRASQLSATGWCFARVSS